MPSQAALTKHRPVCEMTALYKPLMAQLAGLSGAGGLGSVPYWPHILQMATQVSYYFENSTIDTVSPITIASHYSTLTLYISVSVCPT